MKAYKVYLSPFAARKLELILDYLNNEWPERVRSDFIDRLKKKRIQISQHPQSSPESNEFPGLHKAVLDKHTSLYYRVLEDKIEIAAIFDNRQDLKEIRKELNKIR